MNSLHVFRTVLMALVASACVASSSHAINGSVRVTIAKAALVVGAGCTG